MASATASPSEAASSIIPAAPAPSGTTSNFVTPASCANELIIPNVVFMALAIVAVMLRTYTRVYLLRSFGSDDYLIVVALAFSIACTVLAIFMVRYGVGKHMWDIPFQDFSPFFLKFYLADVLTYSASMLFAKLSILFLYRRIFPVNSSLFFALWWSTLIVTVGYLVSSMVASIFSCVPIAMAWDVTITQGHCINKPALYVANTSFGMLTDLSLLVIPSIVLWRLELRRRQKIIVFILLSMGSFTFFVSVYRMPVLIKFLDDSGADVTWNLVPTATWSVIEVNSAIFCACSVTLKPLMNHFLPNFLPNIVMSRTARSRRSSHGPLGYLRPSHGDSKGSKPPSQHIIERTVHSERVSELRRSISAMPTRPMEDSRLSLEEMELGLTREERMQGLGVRTWVETGGSTDRSDAESLKGSVNSHD